MLTHKPQSLGLVKFCQPFSIAGEIKLHRLSALCVLLYVPRKNGKLC